VQSASKSFNNKAYALFISNRPYKLTNLPFDMHWADARWF